MSGEGGTPDWAQSVRGYESAVQGAAPAAAGGNLQFPNTGQLTGMCGGLLGGSAFTSGLMAQGDSSQGTAGALVSGSQLFADGLCGFMGGSGVDTTPQAITAGAQDVSDAVDGSPMAAGTIEMGGSSGNSALDAINGVQSIANTMYGMLSGCGCAPDLAPDNVGPQQIIDSTQQTVDGVNDSPFATGIIGMGQEGGGSGNVALDAINGGQFFVNSLYNIISLCGLCSMGSFGTAQTVSETSQLGIPMREVGDSFATSVSPYDILNTAADTVGRITADPYYSLAMSTIPPSGNLGIDLTNGASQAVAQNTANHAGHQSLTTAQSVSLKNQNLLVAQDFHADGTVIGDDNWSWDGTDGAPSTGVSGCAKVACDGGQAPLVSSEIPVVAGETIEVACEIKWSGLTYTGDSPIVLGVEKYRLMKDPGGSGKNVFTDIGWYDVLTVPSPGSSEDWTGFAGTYEVQPGVDQLRFRLDIKPNATAGVVKWDDATFLKLDLIAGEAVPATGETVDNIVTQLYGAAGSGFTQNQAALALANTSASITSVQAQISALEAEGSTGAIAGDDFSYTLSSLPGGNWGGTSGGVGSYYSVDGNEAVFNGGAWGLNTVLYWQGTDATSDTDYQLIKMLLGSAPANNGALSSTIYVLGRMNGTDSYVQAGVRSDGYWFVGYADGPGSFTTMRDGTLASVPGLGAMLTLYCGDATTSAPRHFKFMIGTTTITEFNETGTGSLIGASNRGWGWASYGDPQWYGSGLGANVNQWLAMDQ